MCGVAAEGGVGGVEREPARLDEPGDSPGDVGLLAAWEVAVGCLANGDPSWCGPGEALDCGQKGSFGALDLGLRLRANEQPDEPREFLLADHLAEGSDCRGADGFLLVGSGDGGEFVEGAEDASAGQEFDRQRAPGRVAVLEHREDSVVDLFSLEAREGAPRGFGHFLLAVAEQFGERGDSVRATDLGQCSDGGHARRGLALFRQADERWDGGRVVAPAEGLGEEDLLVGREVWEHGCEGLGHGAAGHLHRGPGRGLDEDEVLAADCLDEERDSLIAAQEDGPSQRGGADLVGRVRDGAEFVVDGECFVLGSRLGEGFGAAKQPLADGQALGAFGPGQCGLERGGGLRCADRAEGARDSLRDLLVGVAEISRDRADGLCVPADAQRGDHAGKRPAFAPRERIAQGLVNGRVGDRLEGVAGHVVEFGIGEHGDQGRDAPGRPDPGEFATGIPPGLEGGVLGLQDGDELGFALCLAGEGRRRCGDNCEDGSWQHCLVPSIQIVQGARIARERRRLASGSPMNSAFSGS